MPHIVRRRTTHGSGPGKLRWVVQRSIGRLMGPRRMGGRHDRPGGIFDAWTMPAASVICPCIRLLDAP